MSSEYKSVLIDAVAISAFCAVVALSSLCIGNALETAFPFTPKVWTTRLPFKLFDSASNPIAAIPDIFAAEPVTSTFDVILMPIPT
ncbi:hypothetical protein D3C75_1248100 [compost metagenome]